MSKAKGPPRLCPACAAALLQVIRGEEYDLTLADAVDRGIARSLEAAKRMEREAEEAEELLRRAEAGGPARLELTLKNSRLGRTEAMVHRLLQRAEKARRTDLEACARYARLAVEVIHQLPARKRPELLARAYAEMGNACRIREDFRGAKAAFRQVEELEHEAIPSPLWAETLSLRASLHRGLGQPDDAIDDLRRAWSMVHRWTSPEVRVKLMVQLAQVWLENAEFGEAFQAALEALQLAKEVRTPQIQALACWQGAVVLCEVVENCDPSSAEEVGAAALQALELAAGPYRATWGPRAEENLQWARARLFVALGYLQQGERELGVIVGHYLARNQATHAAVVVLDLCETLLRRGRPDHARSWVTVAIPILQDAGLGRNHLAALSMAARLEHEAGLATALSAAVRRASASLTQPTRRVPPD